MTGKWGQPPISRSAPPQGSEQFTYAYDGALLTSEVRTGTLPQTLSFVYNDDFDLTSFTYAGSTATFTYDDDGLVTQAGAFTIARNATTGFPESVSDGTAVLVPSFNGYGEVSAQSVTVGGLPAMSWSLTRNDGGLITAKTETVGGATSNYAYEYDAMGRLLEVIKGGIPVETYTYGANGQRLTETNTLRGITNRTYTYSLEDHLLSADAVTYAYDDDGFLTTKVAGLQTTSYVYSSRGELLEVDLPDNRIITYVHDPMGRRIAKKIDGIIVEKYLWAGMTQLLAVYDASNALIMRFDGARMTRSGSTYYLVTDQVGTVRAVVDTAGAIVKRIDYDSFGNILTDTNPTFTIPFGFAGGLHDRDTGLIRFGARDYDPDSGRWTAKDPIGFAGGDTNLYGYCVGNPVCFADGIGLKFGANTVLAGVGGFLQSIGSTALNTLSIGYFGQDPVSQAYQYGGNTLGHATEGALLTSAAALTAGAALAVILPATATAEVTATTAATSTSVAELIAMAEQRYPKLAAMKDQWHHLYPKYLVGEYMGPLVKIPAAYHQLITNEFRRLWAYGQGPAPKALLDSIMKQVYEKYPVEGLFECKGG